jgi:glycine dehydrogenase subunit 2
MAEKSVFDYNSASTEYIGRQPGKFPDIPASMEALDAPPLPKMSEVDVVRHYTALSRRNFGVDTGFYPLGSCTMKYNPRINESLANDPSLLRLHPLVPEQKVQGLLSVIWNFEQTLIELCGMDRVSFQPAAGAHGELTGIMVIRKYHETRGDKDRKKIIVPDSSHGTNPATSNVAGMTVKQIKSRPDGLVDLDALKAECDSSVAGLMLTNPNTLGLFEKDICEITKIVHDAGGLVYYDGANFNALMGMARPGDMGFDVMQFNLHKTFSTPHGGGGPGSGPVAVKKNLAEYLPAPLIDMTAEGFIFSVPLKSIGRVKSFHGNIGIILRACVYALVLGGDGLKKASETAVLNANYILHFLKDVIDIPMGKGSCLHEFVASAEKFKTGHISALDIAKRLIDYGYHPPTIYFPLIVKEAMMIEPTETESLDTLDRFIADFKKIVGEISSDPELLRNAPHITPVRRVDEAKAARDLLRE